MTSSSKDKGIFDEIIKRKNLSSSIISELYGKVIKHTPYIFSSREDETHDWFSTKSGDMEICYDNLVRNIFEDPEIFKYFLYAVQDPKKEFLGKINAYDYSDCIYRDFNITSLVTIAMDMYADSKDNKIKARVGQVFNLLDGSKHPLVRSIKEGRVSPQMVRSFEPSQVTMLSQSLEMLDNYVINPAIKNGIVAELSDEVDAYYTEHKEYYIEGNLNTMMSTKSEIGSKFTLSRRLHDEVLKNMPKSINGRPITEMEIANYIYTRMCQVLRYDPLYTYNSELGVAQHSSPLKLSSIWPDTPIICYEFSYLYSKFLEEFGIEHAIAYGNNSVSTDKLIHGTLETEHKRKEQQGEKDGYYSNGHTFCIVRAKHLDDQKHTFVADSTRAGVCWDLDSLKTSNIDPRAYSGIVPIDTGRGISKELSTLTEVKGNIAQMVSAENNKVRVNDIYDYFAKFVDVKGITIEQKQQMIRQIFTKANWADDPRYFRDMKEILSQFGVDFEFVIGKVQNYYEVNVLVEYNKGGKKEYDYAYPPGEYETLSVDDVKKLYKEGSIISKKDRFRDSKLLSSLFNQSHDSHVSHDNETR